MTNPVQDRVKTEWGQAQKEGGQRVDEVARGGVRPVHVHVLE